MFHYDNIVFIVAFLCVRVQGRHWGKEAQRKMRRLVGTAVLEMQLFSQKNDVLLVDLWKPSLDPASTGPVSIRGYLVLIQLARYAVFTVHVEPLVFIDLAVCTVYIILYKYN